MGRIRDILTLRRFAGAGFVLLREGVVRRFAANRPELNRARWLRFLYIFEKNSSKTKPKSLTQVFSSLGPNWVKLGQFLATRHDLIGAEAALDLAHLQDKLPPYPQNIAEEIVTEAFGKPLDQCFSYFGPAVAAASIAQVHKAVLISDDPTQNGIEVAVKILRPQIREQFLRDLDDFATLACLAEAWVKPSQRLKPSLIVERLKRSVILEMDLRIEAAALSEFSDFVIADPNFQVPTIYWDHTFRNILTLSWVNDMPLSLYIHHFGHQGVSLGRNKDVSEQYANYADLSPKIVAEHFMHSFLRQALIGGLFHADMHPGNLFVNREAILTGIDFGITERMDRKQQRFLAEILFGFIKGDYQRVAEVHFEAGYVPSQHRVEDFAMACRAIAEPIRGQKSNEISMAHLLTLLFEITELFDMETRPELMLLHKTMLVVEGICRSLDAEFNMWTVSEPLLKTWIEDHFRPDKQLAKAQKELTHALKSAGTLPEIVETSGRLIKNLASTAKHGLTLNPRSLEAIDTIITAKSKRSSLWWLWLMVIGISLALGYRLGLK